MPHLSKAVFDLVEFFLVILNVFPILGVVDTSLLAALLFLFLSENVSVWKVRDLPLYHFLSHFLESAHQHSLRQL